MSIEKYSGQVDLDHPVIDKRPDGTIRMYFHDLPPILLKCPYIISPEDDDDPTPDGNQTTD